jgi:hypothetical protein
MDALTLEMTQYVLSHAPMLFTAAISSACASSTDSSVWHRRRARSSIKISSSWVNGGYIDQPGNTQGGTCVSRGSCRFGESIPCGGRNLCAWWIAEGNKMVVGRRGGEHD